MCQHPVGWRQGVLPVAHSEAQWGKTREKSRNTVVLMAVHLDPRGRTVRADVTELRRCRLAFSSRRAHLLAIYCAMRPVSLRSARLRNTRFHHRSSETAADSEILEEHVQQVARP
jgi:hypothetical protein